MKETKAVQTKIIHKGCIFLAFLLAGIVLPLYAYKVNLKDDYTDFQVYYRAATHAKNLEWNTVYSFNDGASPYRYSPPFLMVFRPFAELSLNRAQLVWYFLQYLAFGMGFFTLFKTLQMTERSRPEKVALWSTCFTFLFVLRFCLDTFTIGQVSSWMFFGFSLGLYGWVNNSLILSSLGILLPTLFKIGPGLLYGGLLNAPFKDWKKMILTSGITTSMIIVGSAFWLGSWEITQKLWSSWIEMVANDANYYDASHYGSQSIKSFLLRGVHFGWYSLEKANLLYVYTAITLVISLCLFWSLRKPKSPRGRGLFFSLGVLVYICLMPEAFKYTLTNLAFPVLFLICAEKKSYLNRFALLSGILFLSLAGKDIVGDTLFFGFQIYSLPLAVTFVISLATLELAWQASTPSPWAQNLKKALFPEKKNLGPWITLPSSNRSLKVSLIIPIEIISLELPLTRELYKTVEAYACLLREQIPSQFEILLIPYGAELSPVDLNSLAESPNPNEIRMVLNPNCRVRGRALRNGFLQSQGELIFMLPIEEPCQKQFVLEILKERKNDRTSVSLKNSRTLAVNWKVATAVLPVLDIQDSLCELEIQVASSALNYGTRVVENLTQKPRTLEIPSLTQLREFFILRFRYFRGYYCPAPRLTGVTADDWGMSPGINQGILKLAQQGVVKRVSLMANCPFLEEGLTELLKLKDIELGLHFNLTYGISLQAHPNPSSQLLDPSAQVPGKFISSPSQFLFQWLHLFRNKNAQRHHVRNELMSQLEKLKSLRIPIQYLDGHHHIHLVPGLISTLADLIHQAGIKQVRLPYDPALWWSSQAPIALLSLLAKRQLDKNNFQYKKCIYPAQSYFLDQGKLRALLSKNPHAEVIVHPAAIDDMATLRFPDSYSSGRVIEYQALQMLSENSL